MRGRRGPPAITCGKQWLARQNQVESLTPPERMTGEVARMITLPNLQSGLNCGIAAPGVAAFPQRRARVAGHSPAPSLLVSAPEDWADRVSGSIQECAPRHRRPDHGQFALLSSSLTRNGFRLKTFSVGHAQPSKTWNDCGFIAGASEAEAVSSTRFCQIRQIVIAGLLRSSGQQIPHVTASSLPDQEAEVGHLLQIE